MTPYRNSPLTRVGLLLVVILLALTACGSKNKKDSNLAPTLPATITLPPTRTPSSLAGQPSPTFFLTPTPFQGFIPTATPLILRPTTVYLSPTWTPLPQATAYPYDIRISYPVDGSQIAGYVTLVGSASHPRFVQYALEWGPDPNPGNLWYPFLSPPQRTNIVLNGVLGSWSTTSVADGVYQIRLHVWLNDGTDTWDLATGIRISNRQPTAVPSATPTLRPNRLPTINPIPSQQVSIGQTTKIAVVTSDPDGDAINLFVASSNPAIANVQVSAASEISVTGVTAGSATITVTANDNHGGVVNAAFIATVQGQNRAPTIGAVPNQTLNVGEARALVVTASDPDNDPLTLTAVSNNTAVVNASASGTNVVNLTGVGAGTANVTVTASDGKGGSVSVIFQVAVGTPNLPPTISPIAAQTLSIGEIRAVNYTATDPEGAALNAVATSDNDGVVSASVTAPGVITLSANAAGSATITVSVNDGVTPAVSTAFTATVQAALNLPPTINPIPAQTMAFGATLDVNTTAVDPENDPLTATAVSDNDGVVSASIFAPGTIRLVANGPGSANVTFSVNDGLNPAVSTVFVVSVAAAPNNNPVIQPVAAQSVNVGAGITVPIAASDPDNDPLTLMGVSDNPAVATASAGGTDVTVQGITPGQANVIVSADDGRGGTVSVGFVVTVVGVNNLPVIQPIPDQSLTVGEQISIPVAASDADGDPLVLTALSQNGGVVTASAVGTDTIVLQGVAEGVANVDFTADDARGGVVTVTFGVMVSSPTPTFDLMAYPVLPDISPSMAGNLALVYQGGVSNFGNQAGAFAKVGDDPMDSTAFMAPLVAGPYDLGNFGALQGLIDVYKATAVRADPAINSLNVDSVAAGGGFGIDSLAGVSPAGAPCDAVGGGTVLSCEFQLSRPTIALVSFSAPNVTFMAPDQFRSELQSLVVTIQSTYGVIPVLTTIPAGGGYATDQLAEYNRAIVEVATQSGVPLWNLWRAMQERGIGDPNSVAPEGPANFTDAALNYGYNIRNLTALQVLQTVRQAVGIQ